MDCCYRSSRPDQEGTQAAPAQFGSELWTLPAESPELLHVTLPIASVRAFYDRYISNEADWTALNAVIPRCNDDMECDSGELDLWNEECCRKMRFTAYPTIVPKWMPGIGERYIRLEQTHHYQFLDMQSLGEEWLQYRSRIGILEANMPYADLIIMTQVWTIKPVRDAQGEPACEIRVSAICQFVGKPPIIASIIRPRSYAEHRAGLQVWLKGAQASLEKNSTLRKTEGKKEDTKKTSWQRMQRTYGCLVLAFSMVLAIIAWHLQIVHVQLIQMAIIPAGPLGIILFLVCWLSSHAATPSLEVRPKAVSSPFSPTR
jgi:hypothetical protein